MCRMWNNKKVTILAALLICSCFAFSGCSKANDVSDGIGQQSIYEQKDYIYVPETEDFISTDSICGICSSTDKLYISTYNEEDKENRAYTIDLTTKLSKPLRLPLEENVVSAVNGMALAQDGRLAFVERYAGDENNEQNNFVYIKTCAPADGKILSTFDITAQTVQNGGGYIHGFMVDKDNNYYLFIDKTIQVFNPEGQLLFEVHPNMKWFLDMTVMKDGQVVFLAAADNDAGLILGVIDTETRKIVYAGENIFGEKDSGCSVGGILATSNVDSVDLFISCNGKVYQYNHKEGIMREKFNWIDSNVNSDKVRNLVSVDEQHFVSVVSENVGEGYETQIVYLTQNDADTVPAKEVLVLATFYSTGELQEMVAYFNQSQEQYQIEIKDYMTGTTDEEQINAYNKMVLDILSGDAADIIDGASLDFGQFASAGVYEDLNPYLTGDEDLKDVEFFQSVIDANTVDGKLFCLPDSFVVDTLAGGVSEFGEVSGLTLDEYMAMEEAPFSYYSQEELLRFLVGGSMEQYVDWSAGVCNFDSKQFKKVLGYIKEEGIYVASAQENVLLEDRDDNKKQLENLWIYNAPSIKIYEQIFIREPITYVGYPISEGDTSNGSKIENAKSFYISSVSKNKEGAWRFIKCFLMPEYYQQQFLKNPENVNFSPRKDLYEWAFGEWMKEDEQITSKDQEIITEVIENAEGTIEYNPDIFDIIGEETGAYFAGQKSVDEVAAIIQNRVQLYMDENR